MDRAVIEGDPHRVLEGLAHRRLRDWRDRRRTSTSAPSTRWPSRGCSTPSPQAKAFGLLGQNILDSGFSLEIARQAWAPARSCAARKRRCSTASRAGAACRARGRRSPPCAGLFGKPTVINNVETLANVPGIVVPRRRRGSRASAPASSKGTKVFALSGKVARTGLVEVAMGTSAPPHRLRHRRRHPRRQGRTRPCRSAARRAAASPTSHLDIDIDYESLKRVGAMMGSGGLVVMDEVDVHGGPGEVLHGLHPARELRQVHPVPRGHAADAGDPREPDAEPAQREGLRRARALPQRDEPRAPRAGHPGHEPVRPRASRRRTRC